MDEDRVQKSRGIEQVREAGGTKKIPLFQKRTLSRQLSENKPNTKLILLCLEFNKSNKQNNLVISTNQLTIGASSVSPSLKTLAF